MKLRTNALSWNPMEAFTLTAANEDGKCVVKVYGVGVGVLECVVWVLSPVQVCGVLGAWLVRSLQCRCVWFWVSGVGAALVRVYGAGVCGLECMVWVLQWSVYSAGMCGFGCMIWVLQWSEFTVQMCVVLGKWCGCCIGQSLQCRCVWFWVHDMGATVVRVYSAGVCGFG